MRDDILNKYSYRVPIILSKRENDELPSLTKTRYLVPCDMTCMHFMCVLRNKLILPSQKALFLFTGKKRLVYSSIPFGQLFASDKCEDGFLRITYASENAFG